MTPNLDGMTALPPLARRPSRTRCLLGTRTSRTALTKFLRAPTDASDGSVGRRSREVGDEPSDFL
jgi:hypothetical protein